MRVMRNLSVALPATEARLLSAIAEPITGRVASTLEVVPPQV